MVICYYNGKYAPMEECSLPMSDLVIQRGVGAFESIRVYGGRTFAMAQHLERLAGSTQGAGIRASAVIEQLPQIIREGLARPGIKGLEGIVKPYITGGDVNDHGTFPHPRFFLVFDDSVKKPSDDERRKGVALEPTHMARPYPHIKSTNYLFGIIPLSKALNADNLESLYITPEGDITEALTSNFFLCKDGRLITAPLGRVLKGVTRDIIVTLARENGFTVEERCPREEELAQADEAFITSSLKEVFPVVRIGTQTIGTGHPGPAVQRLQHIFLQNMSRWIDK